MESSKWEKNQQIFTAVLAAKPNERDARLAELCEGDLELQAEVASLIEASERDGLEDTSLRSEQPALATEPSSGAHLTGSTLGAFTVRHLIAEGGMGQVYYAERDLAGATQAAAIKVVHLGMNSAEVIKRFRREQRILASLDHPQICSVWDAGLLDDGRPYFVMPFVDGAQDLTTYSQQNQIGLNERIRLMIKICQAVHHAHQMLVVHADLKPGNVLVNRDGDPLLLDFGIARSLNPLGHDDRTTQFNSPSLRPHTPRYASPEQLAGQAPGTASDIFSLGVMLWELLANRQPDRSTDFSFPSANPSAEKLPMPRKRWASLIKGDLDHICQKALSPEPTQRYSSAAALAEDLQRWMDKLPVEAQKPTAQYRLRKFVRRHPVMSGISSTALILITATAVAVSLLNQKIISQAEQTQRERDRAESVAEFWAQLFKQTDPLSAQGLEEALSAKDLLGRAESLLSESAQIAPADRAHLLTVISESYWGLGEPELSLAAAKSAVRSLDSDANAQSKHVDAYRHLANIHSTLYQFDEALEAADRAMQLYSKLNLADEVQLGNLLNARALALDGFGRTREAAIDLQKAIDITRARTGEAEEMAFATNLGNLAYMYYRLSKDSEHPEVEQAKAGELLDEALAKMKSLFGPDHPRVSILLNGAGKLSTDRGDHLAAIGYYLDALRIQELHLPPSHEQRLYTQYNLAESTRRSGQTETALAALQELDAILFEHYPADFGLRLSVLLSMGKSAIELQQHALAKDSLLRLQSATQYFRQSENPELAEFYYRAKAQSVRALQASGETEEAEKQGAQLVEDMTSESTIDPSLQAELIALVSTAQDTEESE